MKMRHIATGLLTTIACIAILMPSAAKDDGSDLIVHEWGTFLTMNGSDGITLDGMYHEEHALPPFVHSRSNDQLHVRSALTKGETPVIYFYTKKQQSVNISVEFPEGMWTQWYPEVRTVWPRLSEIDDLQHPRNGHISWRAEILPVSPSGAHPALPAVSSDLLWKYARDVDAAYVRTKNQIGSRQTNEVERFLFYRGLGQSPMPLGLSMDNGGTLALNETNHFSLRHLFVLRVEKGKGVYRYIPSLSPGEKITDAIPSLTDAQPLSDFTAKISDDLAARLVESGLYPKEARAMVNTWKTSYFGSDGLRVLYILPQSWTDATIPIHISPQPTQLVRVMVGRTELLTPEREAKMEAAVKSLSSADRLIREQGFAYLQAQGRYVEPMLRRTLKTTSDEKTQTLCRRLLLTDWVAELRAVMPTSTNGAASGKNAERMPAELVALLKDVKP